MSSADDRYLVFPAGGGEMAALMRDQRWEETPLGPVEHWPTALRAAVRMLLTSRFSMWMGWGDDLTFFYNDAYRADTLASKHPWALGKPAREVWREIWPEIGPRLAGVLADGRATWDESLLLMLERSGYREETYHTFSYSPLHEDDGRIRGVFCVVTEDTRRVISERRVGLLGKVAARTAGAKATEDLLSGLERALALDARDLPFTLTYLFDGGDRTPRLVSHTGFAPGGVAARGLDVGAAWLLRELEATSRVVEVALPPGAWPSGPWRAAPARALVVPIAQQGQAEPAGAFVAGINPHRELDAAYREFVALLVGQIAAGLASAQAYAAERRRAESLAELDRAKTAFFSNVSHEFRTPLTLMLGPLGGLLADPDVPPAFRDELATIHRNGLRLLKLVNTMLDFSRIEAGRASAQFVPTDLAQLTSDLASVFRAATDRAGLRLVVDCPPLGALVPVDRDMWEKIVLNLVSNSFKFTLEGEIAVVLTRRGDRAELVVRDTGVGIPRGEQARVFERFHRVEGTPGRTHEGTGIGLALVQELVRLHGGTIAVDSAPGHGTAFTVSIPIGAAPDAAAEVEPAAEPRPVPNAFVEEALRWLPDAPGGAPAPALDAPRGRLVVADDNADMRDYLRRLLGARWQVETVANGRQALAAIRAARPDLVITDVMMPELDGFGLLGELRGDPALRELPVIMLSARAGEEARIEGLQAGATDYLGKPFASRELVARVETLLMRAALRSAEQAHERQLREALAGARHDAEAANRAKDEFLAMLGHELRNPLAPILTALELMRLRPGVGAERERAVIERQVQHLVGLVDDLLDVSRITRGKVELRSEPLQVGDLIARAIEVVTPLLEEHRHLLSVEVAGGLAVHGDPGRLSQVMSNLLTNAAKYTPSGGRIAVRAWCDGDRAMISVTDNGIGIEPAMLERVFEPFAQARQAIERAQGGLGLGLAIVDNLVKLHRGTVTAHSDGLGRGSVFTLALPLLGEPPVAREAPPAPRATTASEARILIIDDNVDAAQLLADVLAAGGYDTLAAHDGPSALQAAEAFRPQIAVVDLGLPVMDGFELARLMLAEPALTGTKLVALTGYGQAEDRARTAAAGFEAHLVKPVDIEQLRGVIERLLPHH